MGGGLQKDQGGVGTPLAASSPPDGAQTRRPLRNVPSFNRIFTGRETELHALHTALQTHNAALTDAVTALRGMGGVGKTQTAAHYVHLHQAEYAFIFWTRGETP